MYNLLKFISKYKTAFLFLFLELVAFGLIVQNNSYHKAGFLNSANFFTGSINSFYTKFTGYLHLKNENKKLIEENAALKNRISYVEYIALPKMISDTLAINSSAIDSLVIDSLIIEDATTHFQYTPALAISNSTNKKFNYIYLNKGKKHGLHADMGIVEPKGVVGVVVNSTESYAVVMPITNEKSSLSVKVKNQGYFGTLKWEHGDAKKAKIIEISNHVLLNPGDTIITSGYSQIFPQGILIGFVSEAKKIEGNSYLDLSIDLAVDFSKINYTYAIENTEAEEIKSIIIE